MPYGPFKLASYPCPICGVTETSEVLRKIGVAVREEFRIVACTACRFVRVNPRIADERIGELYDADYYCGLGFDRAVDYDGPVSEWTRAENERIVKTVGAALDRPLNAARWLDIGCGTGSLIEAIREQRCCAYGFDDSQAAMTACAARGVPILERRALEELRGTFDIVSAIEVIEHVPDPIDFLRYLISFVRVGGVVYVHTENWNVVRHLPGMPYVMPEGHLQYFTPTSMRRLFARVGLRESVVFDRCWFVWRRLPAAIQRSVPNPALSILKKVVTEVAPGFAPFPVGVRAS